MADASDIHRQNNIPPVFIPASHKREGLSLYDIAPTVLKLFGITPPKGMGRAAIGSNTEAIHDNAYSQEEEEELARRLEDLGYL